MRYKYFCYFMLAVLLNASVNVDDDLYNHWSANPVTEADNASYNKIDFVIEYVVEVCFGADNFFPEHRNPNIPRNAFHKTFLYCLTSRDLPSNVAQHFDVQRQDAFRRVLDFHKQNLVDDASPPPKSSLS